MRKLALLLIGFSVLPLAHAIGNSEPRGSLLELHSCELFAGGCVVSSESTLGGRYMLRAWNFTGGTFAGSELAGLQVAVLQSGSENLAAEHTSSEQAVVYLPKNVTSSQRDALLGWLKASNADLKNCVLTSHEESMEFSKQGARYHFTAGSSISVITAPLESCESGACGEALWYAPRAAAAVFTVAVDHSSRVVEPLLKLKWSDSGKRSVFLGRFGETSDAQSLFVTSSDLCGPTEKLF